MNETDKAYFAGVIDSDGSIGIYKTKYRYVNRTRDYQYVVRLQLTWKKSLEAESFMQHIKASYGGSICNLKVRPTNVFNKQSECIKYSAESRQVYNILKDIAPYMQIKKAKAELCIELVEARTGRSYYRNGKTGQMINKSDEAWTLEDSIYAQSLELRAA